MYRSPNRIPLKRAAEPLATDADAAAAESGMDAAGAVGLAALDVDLPNPLAEPGVGQHAVGGTNRGGERPEAGSLKLKRDPCLPDVFVAGWPSRGENCGGRPAIHWLLRLESAA